MLEKWRRNEYVLLSCINCFTTVGCKERREAKVASRRVLKCWPLDFESTERTFSAKVATDPMSAFSWGGGFKRCKFARMLEISLGSLMKIL